MGNEYPRDMVGYGRNWPDPGWPGGARIAVQFVINYEEGAELNILHGDPASESLLSEFGFAMPRVGAPALSKASRQRGRADSSYRERSRYAAALRTLRAGSKSAARRRATSR